MRNRRRSLRIGVVSLLAVFAGCSIFAPRPDPSRFFTLTPIAGEGAPSEALRGKVLGIGPVTLPRYLDRPELVTRVGPNEVRQATFDFWAGSLQKQFATTLGQNMQILLAAGSIVPFPWYSGSPPDLSVEVDVLAFEPAADGQAHLVARWRVHKGAATVKASESNLSRPAGGDPAASVAALSELLGQLSGEIAAAAR
jgi:uncharacterized lipoprotein YmbA